VKTIYIGLGSNLGDRAAHLRRAVKALGAPSLQLLRVSPIYETEPVGVAGQPWYLNLVVEAGTSMMPMQLLTRTMHIEREMGRVRTTPKGPRLIDIDILLFPGAIIHTPTLELPHPRMAERRFVLAPLADLAPGLCHPTLNRTIAELLADAPEQNLHVWDGDKRG
jgi:2-amino-4-hydroxy-6-hydroxymethyldihydropteridine diphosphokinase